MVHEDQIEQHGGSNGLRDEALLESALARACNRWEYGEKPDLAGSIRDHIQGEG